MTYTIFIKNVDSVLESHEVTTSSYNVARKEAGRLRNTYHNPTQVSVTIENERKNVVAYSPIGTNRWKD